MSRFRYKIIVSDLHLGMGGFDPDGNRNLFEDFHYDAQFAEFLQYYCEGNYAKTEVELILNGDILNHLAVPPEEPFADFLTERVSLERTETIIHGHPVFFDALEAFAHNPKRRITYMMGNHDIGVAWPAVQQLIKNRVHTDIKFFLGAYEVDGLHVEHGNRFLIDNHVDLDNLFLTRGEPEPVLKMPWGNFFVIHFINPLKRERAYVGSVYPFKMYLNWALIHDTRFALKSIFRMVAYFLKLNFVRDPKRNFSLGDTWRILKDFSFPLSLDKMAKKILVKDPKIRFVTFGHTHHATYRQFALGKEYINTGSWNELIGLDIGSLGRHLRFTFAELRLDEKNALRASLKQWKGTHRAVEDMV
ncbi:MAG: hypothetical protein Q7T03_01895 [Deltaproteobacteria bacterium]|nr:hypothetical protein [Deltaproteobacteria bacterium]